MNYKQFYKGDTVDCHTRVRDRSGGIVVGVDHFSTARYAYGVRWPSGAIYGYNGEDLTLSENPATIFKELLRKYK